MINTTLQVCDYFNRMSFAYILPYRDVKKLSKLEVYIFDEEQNLRQSNQYNIQEQKYINNGIDVIVINDYLYKVNIDLSKLDYGYYYTIIFRTKIINPQGRLVYNYYNQLKFYYMIKDSFVNREYYDILYMNSSYDNDWISNIDNVTLLDFTNDIYNPNKYQLNREQINKISKIRIDPLKQLYFKIQKITVEQLLPQQNNQYNVQIDINGRIEVFNYLTKYNQIIVKTVHSQYPDINQVDQMNNTNDYNVGNFGNVYLSEETPIFDINLNSSK